MKKSMEKWVRGIALAMALAAGTAVVVSGVSEVQAQEHGQAAAADGVVNLNTATAEQLQALPGVGRSRAEAIVAMRSERGPFERVEEIMQVRGIGRATFRRLRPMLSVEGATTLGARH